MAVTEKKIFVAGDGRAFKDRPEAEFYETARTMTSAGSWLVAAKLASADTIAGLVALQRAGWRFVPPGEPLVVADVKTGVPVVLVPGDTALQHRSSCPEPGNAP